MAPATRHLKVLRTSGVCPLILISLLLANIRLENMEHKWEFFPRMHRLLCERPNVVPPAVMTGIGLPISDVNIDPQLRDIDINTSMPSQAPTTEGSAAASVHLVSGQVAEVMAGKDKLSLAMQKASMVIKPLSSKKRTLEETLIDISEYVLYNYLLSHR